MQLTRALFAFILALTMAFAPIAASATSLFMSCDSTPPCTSVWADHSGATVEASDLCEKVAKPKEEKSQNGHCAGCCLAHSNATLIAVEAQLSKLELWTVPVKLSASVPFILPDLLYSLKRPPRA
jgi:hypothetical protein